jgi:hypothetical protein
MSSTYAASFARLAECLDEIASIDPTYRITPEKQSYWSCPLGLEPGCTHEGLGHSGRVRAWDREDLSLIDGFSGTCLTYPMLVEGGYRECTTEETVSLRRHRAMTELHSVIAVQMPGEQAMSRDEFATRLRALKGAFT